MISCRVLWALVFFPTVAFGAGAGSFLRLGAGSRAAALGQSYTALVSDATAVYWNPAALTRLSGSQAILSHGVFFNNGLSYDFASFGRHTPGRTAWGTSLQYASVGSLPRMDSTGQSIGEFTPNDAAIALAGAREWEGFSFGVDVKFVQSKITQTARTATLGVSFLSPLLYDDALRVGLAADNWGGSLKFNDQRESLPSYLRAGLAAELTPEWNAVADAEFPKGSDPLYGGGAEFHRSFKSWLGFLRAGYTGRGGNRSGGAGVTVGAGVLFGRTTLDYAVLPDGDIGYTHLFTFAFSFGPVGRPPRGTFPIDNNVGLGSPGNGVPALRRRRPFP